MEIVIPGGSGHLGVLVAKAFSDDGHEVIVLSRQKQQQRQQTNQAEAALCRTVEWDGRTLGAWTEELEGADVVLNLAGRSVNCRYTEENRREITESRVCSVRVLGEAMRQCKVPPRVWLQMSTATIYAHRFDAPNDEATGLIGGNEPGAPETWRFSIEVARAWERALEEAEALLPEMPRTRTVLLRSAMVMSAMRGGPLGPFEALLRLTRLGLGGKAGSGKQYVSWIHEHDFVRSLYWLLERDEVTGPVNLAAPGPLQNAAFMKPLREAWGVPIGLPAARWMLEVGAIFMRTETELILKSRRVVPGVLERGGFTFLFSTWPEAAKELCTRWRAGG